MKTDFERLIDENFELKKMVAQMVSDRIDPPIIIKHDSEQYERDAKATILRLQVQVAELEEIIKLRNQTAMQAAAIERLLVSIEVLSKRIYQIEYIDAAAELPYVEEYEYN